MPSIYAHYTFGEMMKQNFPSDIKKRIDLHKDLFEIGLHVRICSFIIMPL